MGRDIFRWTTRDGDKQAMFEVEELLEWLGADVTVSSAEPFDGGYALLVGKGKTSDEEFRAFLDEEFE